MIAAAAVKVRIKKTKQELTIPCHRHCDGFYILKLFGYRPDDYIILDQGFLDSNGNFYNRTMAYAIAMTSGQIHYGETIRNNELFSEDLW